MHHIKAEGIVIKRRNFGEADRILTVLTKEQGKIQIKAIGVRRITSRRSPHVELLNHCNITLYKGRILPILIEAQSIDSYRIIKDDLTKVGFAYHICELLDGLCAENEENNAVFGLTQQVLARLTTDENIATVIHEFEVELLTTLGFWNRSQLSNQNFDTHHYIENILERKLKSHNMFSKMS